MTVTPRTIEEVLTLLTEQPKALAALTADLPRARLHRRPSRGEWSLNDVLAHLRACSDVWGRCIATIISEERPTIRAIDPRTWARQTRYPELEFAPSLRAYRDQRGRLVRSLQALPAARWSRRATIIGAGRPLERTVLDDAGWLARHERSHLKHIARLRPRPVARRGSATPVNDRVSRPRDA